MSEMLDNVAKALVIQIGSPWKWQTMPVGVKEMWREHARAAIKAMMEPTDKMVTRAYQINNPTEREIWSTMLTAALEESE